MIDLARTFRLTALAGCAALFGCSSSSSAFPPEDAGTAADAAEPDAGSPDSGPSAYRFTLNDVSILIPRPEPPEPRSAFLWLVPGAGESGPYFPAHRIDELAILNGDLPDALGYPAAMIVGVRYDPCFRETIGGPCAAQLRLVAQPVPYDGMSPPAMLDDSAAHLFYALDATEAAAVEDELEELALLSPVSTAGPLSVHPGLVAEGSDGPLGAALRAFVVRRCRADNFFRITVNSFSMDNWGFHRFEWENDHPVRVPLRNIAMPGDSQAWLRQAQRDDLQDPSGTILPDGLESIAYLLDPANYPAGDPAALANAVANITRIENPLARTAEMVDCVSCHLGSQLHLHAERRGVSFAAAPDAYVPPAEFDTRLVLAPELDGNLGVTIMFGYHQMSQTFAVHPSIGRRVVFESAEVAAAINARR